MQSRLCIALLVIAALGCGGKPFKVTQVAGKVTMDGKPLRKASVTFAPMGSKENPNPGPTAQGETDAEGRYKLNVDPATPGAVVGKCRIYITTLFAEPTTEDRDAGGPVRNIRERVPAKYNSRTELVFDVPPGGTDQANFELSSR